jgi:hypothetical protein
MDQQKTTPPSIKDLPAGALQELSQRRIFFGHQSVGYNIIDGIKDVMKENPQIKLNIAKTRKPSDFSAPLFGHSDIGKNDDPTSKTDDFVGIIEQGLGDKVQIVFFKFCFVDVVAGTDVDRLFNDYRSKLAALKEKYPSVALIHWTVPLMTVQTGPKAWIKTLIGRPLEGYDDNISRQQFNDKLRKEYNGKELLFDLAAIESTKPDSSRLSFIKDGKTGYALVPQYTTDGGHLNEMARKLVAEQLLVLLANIANK